MINSLPLSESKPSIENGILFLISLIPANTHLWALFWTAVISSHPVAISMKFRLWIKSPLKSPPPWLTKSISKKPGLVLSQSLKVRTGIFFFKRLPGLVVDLPLICCFFRMSANRRSIVAAEMLKSFSLTSWVIFISLCFSNTGINSDKKGANLLEQI